MHHLWNLQSQKMNCPFAPRLCQFSEWMQSRQVYSGAAGLVAFFATTQADWFTLDRRIKGAFVNMYGSHGGWIGNIKHPSFRHIVNYVHVRCRIACDIAMPGFMFLADYIAGHGVVAITARCHCKDQHNGNDCKKSFHCWLGFWKCYASMIGSPTMNEFSRVVWSLIFCIVSSTLPDNPAFSTDSSCEITGLLPLAVNQ